MKRNTLINGMFECNGGKKGFVLGVCTVLTFATMLLFGCSNLMTSLDGIYRAAGNAPATPPVTPPKAPDIGGPSSENVFTFVDEGTTVATVKIEAKDISFKDIKAKVSRGALADYVVDTEFLGWVVENDASENVVDDGDTFKESATFVAKYAESATLASYIFYDGNDKLGKTIKLSGKVEFSKIKAKAGSALDDTIGEPLFDGWVVKDDVSGNVVNDTATFSASTDFVAKYKTEYAYKFYDKDGTNVATVKLPETVKFSEIVAKAGAKLNDTINDALFTGWKIKGTSSRAVDEEEFSASTDFDAVYREPDKYKSPIAQDDIVGHVWYSKAKKSHLVFNEDMGAYEVTGKQYLAAEAIIKDYFDKEDKRKRNEITSDDLRNYATANFSHTYMWSPYSDADVFAALYDNWENAKVLGIMDYKTFQFLFYYISPDGGEIVTIDNDGNVITIYERID